jgi:glycerol-3-phosphate O-acyltransferase/dihydroxyacetone phosphate acyltransferase
MIQTTRRLYAPKNKRLSAGESLAIARKIKLGYDTMKDDSRIQAIRQRVLDYNKMLQDFGMSDHQVKNLTPSPYRALVRLLIQALIFTVCFTVCLPG